MIVVTGDTGNGSSCAPVQALSAHSKSVPLVMTRDVDSGPVQKCSRQIKVECRRIGHLPALCFGNSRVGHNQGNPQRFVVV